MTHTDLAIELAKDHTKAAHYLELGAYLLAVQETEEYRTLGYDSFASFVTKEFTNSRNAYRAMKIFNEVTRLNLVSSDLHQASTTDLRRVIETSLKDNDKRQLLLQSGKLTKREFIDGVEKATIKPKVVSEIDPAMFTWVNTKVSSTTKSGVIDRAFELIRREYGNAYSSTGVRKDISDGKVLELLCAEKLNGAVGGKWPLALTEKGLINFNIKILRDAKEKTVLSAFRLINWQYAFEFGGIAPDYTWKESVRDGQILRLLCLDKLKESAGGARNDGD